MEKEKIFVKNMVCPRCIRVIGEDLAALGLPVHSVHMGEVWMSLPLNQAQRQAMGEVLRANGFEVLSSREEQLVEQVKQLVVQHVWGREKKPESWNFSDYLAQATLTAYPALSRLFTAWTSTTIEQFIIQQKIERAKELLTYGQDTLSEIAWEMGYSSPQHLSAQFKKVTGMTPTQFREIMAGRQEPRESKP